MYLHLYVLQNSVIAVDHMEGMMPDRLIGLKANIYSANFQAHNSWSCSVLRNPTHCIPHLP